MLVFTRVCRTADEGKPEASGSPGWRSRLTHRHPRAVLGAHRAVTVLAALLVFGALLLPDRVGALRPGHFVRLPGEAVVGAVVLLALPRRGRRAVAAAAGAALGALTVLNVLDMGFREYLGRGFDPVLDWELLDDARAYVADSLGGATAGWTAAGAVAVAVLLPVATALAAVRLAEALAAHRTRARQGALAAATVWITCSALGLQQSGVPLAAARTAGALRAEARQVRDTVRDEAAFERATRADVFAATPGGRLVPELRGKDVLFAFVESYGRTAVEDPEIGPAVGRTLDARTRALAKAGFRAESGWLTSATYGGNSWLGHSTFLSGLWVDNQQRYRTVVSGDRLTLTGAFRRTGAWDTVGIMPGVRTRWPEAEFFGLDTVYDASRLGYEGPRFGWSTMPDQYALEAFQRLEHGRERDRPLMAEIVLTSSHQPWAPVPRMVGWDELGDGSGFEAVRKAGEEPAGVIADPVRSKRAYGASVRYSVTALTEWLQRYGTDDTVLVLLGDHQPIARVSGGHANRDVPVSIVARDPEVLAAVADWHWTPGLRPAPDAPVWRMNAFRDRFLRAYGSVPGT